MSQHVVVNDGDGEGSTMTIENSCYFLVDNEGMGSAVYMVEQQEALLERLIGLRERFLNFIKESESENGGMIREGGKE